jgi:hypothetical protein
MRPAGPAHHAIPGHLSISSSGSGSSLSDPPEAADRAGSADVERGLQRKLAQKEAQQRYRCVDSAAEPMLAGTGTSDLFHRSRSVACHEPGLTCTAVCNK